MKCNAKRFDNGDDDDEWIWDLFGETSRVEKIGHDEVNSRFLVTSVYESKIISSKSNDIKGVNESISYNQFALRGPWFVNVNPDILYDVNDKYANNTWNPRPYMDWKITF